MTARVRTSHWDASRLEWRGEQGTNWRRNDGRRDLSRGREWSLVIDLHNGTSIHSARYVAWRQP